jgi:hypothetical protein
MPSYLDFLLDAPGITDENAREVARRASRLTASVLRRRLLLQAGESLDTSPYRAVVSVGVEWDGEASVVLVLDEDVGSDLDEDIGGVKVVRGEEPQPQGTGDDVVGALAGTVGSFAILPNGSVSALTAGHVTSGQSHVKAAGMSTKVWVQIDPKTQGPGVHADIAALDTTNLAVKPPNGLAGLHGFASARAGDLVSIWTQGGANSGVPVAATVTTFSGFVRKRQSHWGAAYGTSAMVTKGGDSGAVVTLTNRPGYVVGHVVGGSARNNTTYIQGIEWQLSALKAEFHPV